MMDPGFMADTFLALLSGLPLTLKLAFFSVACGAVLAMLLAFMRISSNAVLSWAARSYVFVFRGTPLLVQLFLIYYGLGQFHAIRTSFLWAYLREPYWCALLSFTLCAGAYASEVIRGGLLSVSSGQIEAARACGMPRGLMLRRIVLPLMLRQALPAYGSEIILMIKATSLASTITMMEVTGIAAKLISQSFRAVEIFICAAAMYLILNFLVTRLVYALEYWLSPHLRQAIPLELRAEAAHV